MTSSLAAFQLRLKGVVCPGCWGCSLAAWKYCPHLGAEGAHATLSMLMLEYPDTLAPGRARERLVLKALAGLGRLLRFSTAVP